MHEQKSEYTIKNRWYASSGKFIAIVTIDGTGGYTVIVTRDGVDDFTGDWPCSHLRGPIRFEFAANGDLVDIRGTPTGHIRRRRGTFEEFVHWFEDGYEDGYDLLALSQDAEAFGALAREKQRTLATQGKACRWDYYLQDVPVE